MIDNQSFRCGRYEMSQQRRQRQKAVRLLAESYANRKADNAVSLVHESFLSSVRTEVKTSPSLAFSSLLKAARRCFDRFLCLGSCGVKTEVNAEQFERVLALLKLADCAKLVFALYDAEKRGCIDLEYGFCFARSLLS